MYMLWAVHVLTLAAKPRIYKPVDIVGPARQEVTGGAAAAYDQDDDAF